MVERIISFLKEVQTEAKRVNWPNREQTMKNTMVVIVFSLTVAAFLGIFDFIFQVLLDKVII